MLGNFITIDGVNSRTLGLFCKQLPMFPVAVQGFNTASIGGRLDDLYQAANHYGDIQLDIEAVLVGFDMDPIIRYFTEGKQLVFSNIPDRYAVIRQLVAIDQKRVGNGAIELRITLKCSPFKYRLDNSPRVVTSSPEYFRTVGTIYSEPLIVAKGCSAGFTMSLNGAIISTTDLTGDIYFDVPNRVVYQIQNGVKTVVQNKTVGDIWNLMLVPSTTEYNEFIFSGAGSVEITKNERWL